MNANKQNKNGITWTPFSFLVAGLILYVYFSISWYQAQAFIELQGVGYLIAIVFITLVMAIMTIILGVLASRHSSRSGMKAGIVIIFIPLLTFGVIMASTEYNFYNLIQLSKLKALNSELTQVISDRYNVTPVTNCYTEDGSTLIVIEGCNERQNSTVNSELKVYQVKGELVYQTTLEAILGEIKAQYKLPSETSFEGITVAHSTYDVKAGKIQFHSMQEHFILIEVVNHNLKVRQNFAISYDGKGLLIRDNNELDYLNPRMVIAD